MGSIGQKFELNETIGLSKFIMQKSAIHLEVVMK